jgi:PAS domain S-box-containing protein
MQELAPRLSAEATVQPDATDRYRTLFERVNAAAFLTTKEGRILEANHRASEFFGYDWSDLPRYTLQDLLPKDTDWASIHDELAARGGLNFETDCVGKDGSLLPAEVSLSIFRMDGAIAMFVLLWDIRERRKTQQRLKESEEMYRGLFEFAIDGIVVLDAHGDIIDVNTKVCQMLGMAKTSLLGRNLFSLEVLLERSLPIVISQFESLLVEKRAAPYTTEIQTATGAVLDVEISSFFLVKLDNEVDNFVLLISDNTERNSRERCGRQEHELFQTLLNSQPDELDFKDTSHRYLAVNVAKAASLGTTPDQVVGRTDADFLTGATVQQIVQEDAAVLSSGTPVGRMERVEVDDTVQYFEVTKLPVHARDGCAIALMTRRRRLAEGTVPVE